MQVTVGQVSEILNNIVDVIILDEDNAESVSREGRMRLVFHMGGCGREAAYTGTYLYVRSFESSEAGVVALDDILNYCFVKFPDADAVFFERKGVGENCSYSRANLTRLVNPHFTVVVGITSQVSDGRATRDSALSTYLDPDDNG